MMMARQQQTSGLFVYAVYAAILSTLTHAYRVTIPHWNYDNTSQWSIGYPDCKGDAQSPINIQNAEFDASLVQLKFNGYYKMKSMEFDLQNNGHTAVVVLDPRSSLSMEGGGLPGIYKPHSFHFHWGSDRKTGSEHFVNGKQFPLEMHIVHYNTKYPNITVAKTQENGLAALSVLFEVGEKENEAAVMLFRGLSEITEMDDMTTIKGFNMLSMLPADRTSYYRYQGSLTTPGCHETVVWTVFATRNYISDSQIDKLRSLKYVEKHVERTRKLVNNYRPLQDINKRKVYKSFKEDLESRGTAGRITLSWAMAVAMTVAASQFARD